MHLVCMAIAFSFWLVRRTRFAEFCECVPVPANNDHTRVRHLSDICEIANHLRILILNQISSGSLLWLIISYSQAMSTEVKQSDARVTAIFSVLQSPALCRYLLHHCTFEDTVAFGDTCRISQAAAKQEWTNKTDLLIPAATEGPLTWRLGTHVISALERAVSLALRYCRQLRSISCNATSLTEDAGVTGRTQSLDALLRLVEANRGTLQRLEWAAASPADSALLFTALCKSLLIVHSALAAAMLPCSCLRRADVFVARCPRMTTIKAVGVPDGKLMKLFAACPDLCDVTVGHFMLDEFLKTGIQHLGLLYEYTGCWTSSLDNRALKLICSGVIAKSLTAFCFCVVLLAAGLISCSHHCIALLSGSAISLAGARGCTSRRHRSAAPQPADRQHTADPHDSGR